MTATLLEHINITVSDPKASAAKLCKLFDWHIRWEGPAMNDGYTVHVGSDTQYLALYAPPSPIKKINDDKAINMLNHIAINVEDLETVKTKAAALGYAPFNDRQYLDNQKSFYFLDDDGIEFEIVNYD